MGQSSQCEQGRQILPFQQPACMEVRLVYIPYIQDYEYTQVPIQIEVPGCQATLFILYYLRL